jgi:hypothetical protein
MGVWYFAEDTMTLYRPHGIPGAAFYAPTSQRFILDRKELDVAGTFDFQEISSAYKHLALRMLLRSTRASALDDVQVSYNDDVAAPNYDRHRISAAATTVGAGDSLGGAGQGAVARQWGATPAASATSGLFSYTEVEIPGYLGSQFKIASVKTKSYTTRAAGGLLQYEFLQGWASTSPIESITITPVVGPAFAIGSWVELVGLIF